MHDRRRFSGTRQMDWTRRLQTIGHKFPGENAAFEPLSVESSLDERLRTLEHAFDDVQHQRPAICHECARRCDVTGSSTHPAHAQTERSRKSAGFLCNTLYPLAGKRWLTTRSRSTSFLCHARGYRRAVRFEIVPAEALPRSREPLACPVPVHAGTYARSGELWADRQTTKVSLPAASGI